MCPLLNLSWPHSKTRITFPLCPTPLFWISFFLAISFDRYPAQHTTFTHQCKVQLHNLLSSSIILYEDSCIDRSPTVSFNAVNAAGPIGSGGNIIQVCSHHTSAAGTRPINLGGGVVQTLVSQLLAAKSCSNSWGKVDVTFIRLIHLRLVGEQDLGF